jgi:carbon storage regulator
MLVLSRKPGEKVIIGNNITVTVASIIGNKVRLAFTAPDDIRVLRSELACWLNPPPASAGPKDDAPPSDEPVTPLKG